MCTNDTLALPYLTDTCDSKLHNRTTIHVHTNEIPGAHWSPIFGRSWAPACPGVTFLDLNCTSVNTSVSQRCHVMTLYQGWASKLRHRANTAKSSLAKSQYMCMTQNTPLILRMYYSYYSLLQLILTAYYSLLQLILTANYSYYSQLVASYTCMVSYSHMMIKHVT